MRSALPALTACLALLAAASQPAVAQSAANAPKPLNASPAGQSDAAERHARRTACLQDAKSKKLVGAQKTAFVKDCMAAGLPSHAAVPAAGSASP